MNYPIRLFFFPLYFVVGCRKNESGETDKKQEEMREKRREDCERGRGAILRIISISLDRNKYNVTYPHITTHNIQKKKQVHDEP